MGVSGGPDIIQDGLVFEVDASDRNSYPTTGTTWFDLSGNRNNGTLTNGPTFNSANGGSIVFDGTNDFVNCGTSFTNLTTQLSINLWGKINGSPIDGVIVTKGENGYLAVDYAKLSIVALKGLKLLKEENEKLKKELSELEK